MQVPSFMQVAYKSMGTLQSATIAALRAPHEAAIAADHSALASRLSAFVRSGGPAPGSRPRSPSASTTASSASLAAAEGAGTGAAGAEAPPAAPAGKRSSTALAPAVPIGTARPPVAPRPPAPHQPRAASSPPELLQVASLRLLLAGAGTR
jgi:hypothetical protein